MGNVLKLSDYKPSAWEEIFSHDDGHVELHVFTDKRTGELEIFQMADGQGTRTCLSPAIATAMLVALKASLDKK